MPGKEIESGKLKCKTGDEICSSCHLLSRLSAGGVAPACYVNVNTRQELPYRVVAPKEEK